jgi:hypothetical protein
MVPFFQHSFYINIARYIHYTEIDMQGFKDYLTEATKPSGAEWESIICVAYNMASKGIDKNKSIAMAETNWKSEKFDPWFKVGQQIVENSFGKKPSGIMKHFGSSSAELTKEWESYFIKTTGKKATAPTKTPKTDMYIGNQHVSLKKYGGSQLMSGGKAETLATFAHAYANIPKSVKNKTLDASWNKLQAQIEKEFISFSLPAGGQITDYKNAIKAGVKDKMTLWVKDRLQNQTMMTEALRELLSTPEVNLEVVREAMTGNKKFGEPLPIATHIMKFDEDGKSDYIKIDNKYTAKVASKTQFNISFKSSGTGKQAWTATKGVFNESYEADLIESAWDYALSLNEGLFDKITSGVKQGVDFLKNVLKKMLNFIWDKVRNLLSSGIDYVQSILGVTMEANDPMVNY